MKKINWGIIGCGNIAGDFAKALAELDEAVLYAAGSRTPGKAEKFALDNNFQVSYDNYEDLLNDEKVDVVYVATTHNFHYENVLQCLRGGKHVLCEKVFTINAKQAKHLQQEAAEKKLFLMEAMWSRFLPISHEIKKIIKSGEIGDVKFLQAEFSFKAPMNPEGRMYNRELAGGSLMDQGIYPISYASMIFGEQPEVIKTNACMAETGVDERASHIFEYSNGRAAMLTTSIAYYQRTHAIVAGTKGHIDIPEFFYGSKFTVKIGDYERVYKMPVASNGKGYEAQEVMDCINAGKIQSDIMPLDESVELMETIDRIRKDYGLVYPEKMEKSEQ